jgi:Zn-dependent membrane protease YugP
MSGVTVNIPSVIVQAIQNFSSNQYISNTNSRIHSLSSNVFNRNSIQVIGMSKEDKRLQKKKDLADYMARNNLVRNVYINSNNNIN